MRILSSISLLVTFLLVGCGPGETSTAPTDTDAVNTAEPIVDDQQTMMEFGSLIEPGNVGEISVKMEVSELKDVFGESNVVDATRSDEGEEYDIFNILDENGKLAFEVTPFCDTKCLVDRILVYTEDYTTVQGIGVGSTFADIEAAHTGLDIFAGNYGIMVYTKELQKVAYVLEVDGLSYEPNQEFAPSEILDDSKVVAVYTF